MSDIFRVSHSKIKTWRRCRRMFYYKYILKLRKLTKGRPLLMGSILHSMLEAEVNGDDPWNELDKYEKQYNKLFKEEKEVYGDLIDQAEGIMENYFYMYRDDPLEYMEFQGKKAEFEFDLPLIENINIVGFIDRVADRKSDGLRWIMDHKSGKNFTSIEDRFRDLQGVIYVHFGEEIGLGPIDGVCWDHIRSKAPVVPTPMKDGKSLSKNKNMDTTFRVYNQSLKKYKIDPQPYKAHLKHLKEKPDRFCERYYLPVNRKMVTQLIDEVKQTSIEMRDNGKTDHTRNMDQHCNTICDYYELCHADLLGKDTDYLIGKNFVREEKRRGTEEKQKINKNKKGKGSKTGRTKTKIKKGNKK